MQLIDPFLFKHEQDVVEVRTEELFAAAAKALLQRCPLMISGSRECANSYLTSQQMLQLSPLLTAGSRAGPPNSSSASALCFNVARY